MAQIHALLMVTKHAMSAEEIMASLQISRGNANMNLRALMDWGLVHKEMKSGDRKEYFTAEKDIWEVARKIIAERKKREIEPVSRVLEEVSKVEGDDKDEEVAEFKEMIGRLQDFVYRMDKLTETAAKADRSWFYRTLMKILAR